MYSVLVEVSDKLILKMLHISPPNGKVAAIRQVQSPTALFANVGKIYEKAVVAAAKSEPGRISSVWLSDSGKNFSPCVI